VSGALETLLSAPGTTSRGARDKEDLERWSRVIVEGKVKVQ